MGDGFFFFGSHALIRDHPCLRGEYRIWKITLFGLTGSPLLARGIQDVFPCLRIHLGITPAYAGNTEDWQGVGNYIGDHPRLRGEY